MSDLVPKGLSAGEYATRLAVLKVMEKRVKALQTATKAAARATFLPGDRKIAEHDGVRLGSVTLTKGRAGGFKVTDPKAFLAWCKVHRPTAVVITASVRESDEQSLLEGITKGGPVPDGVTETDPGQPYFTVTADDEAVAGIDWRPYVNPQQIEGTNA